MDVVGLYQDLVIPVTNFNNDDKGLMVLAGDVFDVPIRKDIVHRVVRWQLAKRRQVGYTTINVLLWTVLEFFCNVLLETPAIKCMVVLLSR